jgi:hypothetical protein
MTAERESPARRPLPRSPLPVKTDDEFEQAPENQPRGVATAIIFDWSLMVFLGTLLIIAIVQRGLTSRQAVSAAGLALLIGLPLVGLGELLRRGRRVARSLQIAVSGLIAAGNIVGLLSDLARLTRGVVRPTTSLPALAAGLFIIWGLTRPQTIAWFARISMTRARERHGGSWLLLTLDITGEISRCHIGGAAAMSVANGERRIFARG